MKSVCGLYWRAYGIFIVENHVSILIKCMYFKRSPMQCTFTLFHLSIHLLSFLLLHLSTYERKCSSRAGALTYLLFGQQIVRNMRETDSYISFGLSLTGAHVTVTRTCQGNKSVPFPRSAYLQVILYILQWQKMKEKIFLGVFN